MGGLMDEPPAVVWLRHYGNLRDAIEALKAVADRVALDEPGTLTEVAALKAKVAGLQVEVARLTEEIKVLRALHWSTPNPSA